VGKFGRLSQTDFGRWGGHAGREVEPVCGREWWRVWRRARPWQEEAAEEHDAELGSGRPSASAGTCEE